MKRFLFVIAVILLSTVILAPAAEAYEVSVFDDSVDELKNSLSDDVRQRMEALRIESPEDVDQLQISDVFTYLVQEVSEVSAGPLAAGLLVLTALLIVSILEGYTDTLRHTQMKEIMATVTSLYLIVSVVVSLSGLLKSAVSVIEGASALLLLYLPLMVGILIFSGHIVQAGGYYTTVMTAAHVIAWLSSTVLLPILSAQLAVSTCAGISRRVRVRGFCDMAYRFVRWVLTLVMCVFTAILGLQTVTASAADTVASRAARFTLSSLIPVVGSAVSDAYKTLQSSVNLLRSGIGVFVLVAVVVSFLPVLLQALIWQLTLQFTRHTAVMLHVDTASSVLESLSSVIAMLTAIMISVLLVFLISTASLLTIGGAA